MFSITRCLKGINWSKTARFSWFVFLLYQLLSLRVNNNLLVKFIEAHFTGRIKDLAEV